MEHIIKQLKNAAKDTRLSPVEKAAIKSQLLHYAKMHPVNTSGFAAHSIPSPFSIQNFRNKKTLSAFVIGGLLLGSSVSFASEGSLPGDLLYPVKIHVNEQVLAAIAITPQAKADWTVRKAERRLEEVEKLAVAPTATPEVKAMAEENFNTSANQVQEHIANFEKDSDSEDALATAGKFTEMLRKHEGALDKKNFERVIATLNTTPSGVSASLASTSTPTEPSKAFNADENGDSLSSVLENVRGARGDAEKKQKELTSKYQRETLKGNTGETAPAGEASNKGKNKEVLGHDEEIRTAPSIPMKESSKTENND